MFGNGGGQVAATIESLRSNLWFSGVMRGIIVLE
jgi:hypothetical protein